MNEPIHQVPLTTEHRDRITVSDSLAENNQIRHHTGNLRIAADPVAKAGLYLIKEEDEIEPIRQLPQTLVVTRFRFDDPDILENRLCYDSRNRILVTHAFQ